MTEVRGAPALEPQHCAKVVKEDQSSLVEGSFCNMSGRYKPRGVGLPHRDPNMSRRFEGFDSTQVPSVAQSIKQVNSMSQSDQEWTYQPISRSLSQCRNHFQELQVIPGSKEDHITAWARHCKGESSNLFCAPDVSRTRNSKGRGPFQFKDPWTQSFL